MQDGDDGRLHYACACCGKDIAPDEPHWQLDLVTLYGGRNGAPLLFICGRCLCAKLGVKPELLHV
ncbi:MAG: hypothetical protein PHU85_11095 [Phycisphaerae bacterium]|nr:hypothetical protein [Phycisphaerae bacterium]